MGYNLVMGQDLLPRKAGRDHPGGQGKELAVQKLKERARSLWKPGSTLSQRVVRGGFWVFALRITNRLLTLTRTIVLARILAPSDFGLMGIALLAMSTLRAFSQTGFQAALIQKKEDIEGYLDTAWTVSALRGLVLFVILYLAAPHIALFFDAPAATPIMRVIGLSMLLAGLTNIGVVYFQKELEFNKRFVYQLSGAVADLVVAITAALLLRSVWALALGVVAGSLARLIVSYASRPHRPRPRLERAKARELFNFGMWVVGSNAIVFLALQGDDIFLGKVLGVTALGFYQMAYRFSNIAATEITDVIGQVTFPTYSKLQGNIPKLGEGFLRTVEAVAALSFPLSAGIFILAPDFVRLLLGEKWMPIVAAFRILTIAGLIRSIQATGGALFRAVGRPSLDFGMNLVRVIVMGIAIYPLTATFGLSGTAMAVALGISATIPVWWHISSRIIGGGCATLFKSLLPSLTGTVFASAIVLAARHWMGRVGIAGCVVLVLGGSALYAAFLFLLWRWFRYGPVGNLRVLSRSL